ncbi:rhomboid family intramembrane serine protease [Flavobacteriaceae bacterium]|nr:rhomboid family intramembrane serine protease [Flavobacteriaceae bacterium]
MQSLPPLILAILVVNVLFSLKGFKDTFFFNRFKFSIAVVKGGQSYRIVSSAFLHVDMAHLGFNMFALYLFGGQALAGLGFLNFLILYFSCLIAGNLFALYFHRDNPYYSAVGASGAIMGILYATILMYPEMKLALFIFPVPLPGYVFGIGYLVYTLFGMKKQQDNIGHTAHFGGAIGGILTTLILAPSVIETSFTTLVLLVVVTVVTGFILFKKN